eukprot:3864279-Rhodomonas_salina.2
MRTAGTNVGATWAITDHDIHFPAHATTRDAARETRSLHTQEDDGSPPTRNALAALLPSEIQHGGSST